MTPQLHELLGQLVDHDARAAAAAAPDHREEARQIRTAIRRRRAGRVAVVGAAAAAVVAIGLVAGNAVTPPPAPLPAGPGPTRSAAPAPTPAATPAPAPSAPAVPPTPGADPAAPVVTSPPRAQQPDHLTHGGEVWGVYVAVVDAFDSAAAAEATARIEDLGYQAGVGDVSCDAGAVEALGIPDQTLVVSAYFVSEQDAQLFAETYGGDVLGIVDVTLRCLD